MLSSQGMWLRCPTLWCRLCLQVRSCLYHSCLSHSHLSNTHLLVTKWQGRQIWCLCRCHGSRVSKCRCLSIKVYKPQSPSKVTVMVSVKTVGCPQNKCNGLLHYQLKWPKINQSLASPEVGLVKIVLHQLKISGRLSKCRTLKKCKELEPSTSRR